MDKYHRTTIPYKILFTQSAMDAIEQETLRYREQGLETGGILVGKKLDDGNFLIVAATGAGPMADHAVHTFAPDHDFANRELRRARSRYNNVDYVGLWHKHPPQMDYPSGGDWQQVQDILGDPDYKVNGELVTPIIVVRGEQIVLRAYYVSTASQDFAPVEYVVVPNDDPRVQEVTIPEHPIDRLYARFEEERAQLIAIDDAIDVQITSLDTEHHAFTVRYLGPPQIEIYLICGSDYPQSSPQMIFSKDGVETPVTSTVLNAWMPIHTLKDVVGELLEPYLYSQYQSRPAPERRLSRLSDNDRADNRERQKSPLIIGLAITIPSLMMCLVVVMLYLSHQRLTQDHLFLLASPSPILTSSPVITATHTPPPTWTPMLAPTLTPTLTVPLVVQDTGIVVKFDPKVNKPGESTFYVTSIIINVSAAEITINRAGFLFYVDGTELEKCVFEVSTSASQLQPGSKSEIESQTFKLSELLTPSQETCKVDRMPCLVSCYSEKGIMPTNETLFGFRPFVTLDSGAVISGTLIGLGE